jgi:hypothetical protein
MYGLTPIKKDDKTKNIQRAVIQVPTLNPNDIESPCTNTFIGSVPIFAKNIKATPTAIPAKLIKKYISLIMKLSVFIS